jgi:hypothetical protein
MNDMNEPSNRDLARLNRILEQATAANPSAVHGDAVGGQPPEPVETEAESLRETWLAFTELVRAADDSLPALAITMPATTLPTTTISTATIPTATIPTTSKPHAHVATDKSPRRRWLGLIAAAAAMLLCAVCFGWWIVRDLMHQNRQGGNPEPAVVNNAQPEHPQPQTVKQDLPNPAVDVASKPINKSANAATATNVAATATTTTWDDPLETQIVAVSHQIRNVEQRWQHRTDDVDVVQYSIDRMSDSVQNDEL